MKPTKTSRFIDFAITETKPTAIKRLGRQYRICSITKRGNERYINLRLPVEVQNKILQAYSQGKQVRIFA
jgi:hypothetical protein